MKGEDSGTCEGSGESARAYCAKWDLLNMGPGKCCSVTAMASLSPGSQPRGSGPASAGPGVSHQQFNQGHGRSTIQESF